MYGTMCDVQGKILVPVRLIIGLSDECKHCHGEFRMFLKLWVWVKVKIISDISIANILNICLFHFFKRITGLWKIKQLYLDGCLNLASYQACVKDISKYGPV